MSSSQPGNTTSRVAVTDISPDGVWLLAADEELFMPFENFPWFKQATVEHIFNVVEEVPGSFRWPKLDIDLSIESIRDPRAYPQKARS